MRHVELWISSIAASELAILIVVGRYEYVTRCSQLIYNTVGVSSRNVLFHLLLSDDRGVCVDLQLFCIFYYIYK